MRTLTDTAAFVLVVFGTIVLTGTALRLALPLAQSGIVALAIAVLAVLLNLALWRLLFARRRSVQNNA